jgi:hypothetical protein
LDVGVVLSPTDATDDSVFVVTTRGSVFSFAFVPVAKNRRELPLVVPPEAERPTGGRQQRKRNTPCVVLPSLRGSRTAAIVAIAPPFCCSNATLAVTVARNM